MNLTDALNTVIKPGLALLPEKMNTTEAVAMLLAIGKQESRFEHRKQINGPARGFFQFEKGGGVRGVMKHPATKRTIQDVIFRLGVNADDCYDCLATDDALATVFARLLLYTHSKPLPSLASDPEESWQYYIDTWRPGKPHRETWDQFRIDAVNLVQNIKFGSASNQQ